MMLANLRRITILASFAIAALIWLILTASSITHGIDASTQSSRSEAASRELAIRVSNLESERNALNAQQTGLAILADDPNAAASIIDHGITLAHDETEGDLLSLRTIVDGSVVRASWLWRGAEADYRSVLEALAAQFPGLEVERVRLRRITDLPGNIVEVEVIAVQTFEIDQ